MAVPQNDDRQCLGPGEPRDSQRLGDASSSHRETEAAEIADPNGDGWPDAKFANATCLKIRSFGAHIPDCSALIRSQACNVKLARRRKRPPGIARAGSKRRRCCSKPRHSQVESLMRDDMRQSHLRNAVRGTTEG